MLTAWQTIKGLPRQKQLALGAAAIAVAIGMAVLVNTASAERMTLLYAGLEVGTASEVIAELEQEGVDYELRGETIFVAESDRDIVRLRLAGKGLPRQSVQGYELLDGVSAFSTTSEMYNATYWRAKEGELTRTILAMPGILSARVHIAVPSRSSFTRRGAMPTASVTVSTASRPDSAKAEAIQYLVALSVPDLDPSEVVVIDARHGIVAGNDKAAEVMPSRMAMDRTLELEQRILNLLEARLGPGNARVSVNVDVDRDVERTSSVSIDPDSRVLRSRTIDEMAEDNQGGGSAITVASNLPQNTSAPNDARRSTRENSRESVTYEFSETRTETERLPGTIRRISVAAVLNADALQQSNGTALTAEAQQELISNFNALIAAVAGFDESRGDVLQIEIMPFSPVEVPEMVPAPTLVEQMIRQYGWSGAQLALLALVIIILGIGVIRPLISQPKRTEEETRQPALTNDPEGGSAPQPDPVELLNERASDREKDAADLLFEWLADDRKVAVND